MKRFHQRGPTTRPTQFMKKIIFITASKQESLRERAEELNAAGFFEKPFDTEKLLAAITRTLQSRHSMIQEITK